MNRMSKYLLLSPLVLLILTASPRAIAQCSFDKVAYKFTGSAAEQTSCLLRDVKRWAKISNSEFQDDNLLSIVGTPVKFSNTDFEAYLSQIAVDQSDIGGPVSESLSRASNNDSSAPYARYFVIHDTSAPNYGENDFPDNINKEDWGPNSLTRYKSNAHVFISRIGDSQTKNTFAIPYRATKREVKELGILSKGLFLHIELVQPRRSDASGSRGNDAIHPVPAFTGAQLERLALVYLAASLRRKSYLIPAFHAVVDESFDDRHDDPQGFPTGEWVQMVFAHVNKIDRLSTTHASELSFP